ncbi:hypothetical protein PtA15_13A235 [Puccinia triticina]|nr:uncharacterized protein PtA15_13A235 [Puccinia triticina]WAQ90836.1 hypothetical protein PtA15_13A235 [Puccinia triticina]
MNIPILHFRGGAEGDTPLVEMFKFEFDLDDLTDENDAAKIHPPEAIQPPQDGLDNPDEKKEPRIHDPCMVIPVAELIDQLPPFITYSNLKITTSLSIYKRELYDAKYQTIVNLAQGEEEEKEDQADEPGETNKQVDEAMGQKTLDSLQSSSDLIPGVYEGGFKTWECSLDLATHLGPIFEKLADLFSDPTRLTVDHIENRPDLDAPYRILEIGCGTAVPTVSLCFKLFAYLLTLNRSHPPVSASNGDSQDELEPPILEIILQDFNSDVLRLLTFPNILLAFYRATLIAGKSKQPEVPQEASDAESTSEEGRAREEMIEEDLEITDELKTEFGLFLRENRIRLTFVYGPWSTFELPAISPSQTSNPPRTESGREKEIRKGCEVIMSSETLYSTDSLPDLINVLLSSKITSKSRLRAQQEADAAAVESTILIASKAVYFGVGGGTHSFIDLVENRHNGSVSFIDLHHPDHPPPLSNGVSRVLMDVKFSA